MKKFVVTALLALVVSVSSTDALATGDEVNNIKEQGSILVYPLIDNLSSTGNRTVIEVTNRANFDVWLQGFMIVRIDMQPPYYFVKKDFLIHLTQKEPFFWDTSKPYDRVDVDGIRTQIQSFDNYVGFCFLWAVDNDKDRLEISHNYLKGDAVVLDDVKAFQYNPIPHQGLTVLGDRILNLDGIEYTMATSQVMVEGFAEGDKYPGQKYMGGKWVVCSLDIDFINSIQPMFDINLDVWNQYEVYQSRHLDFYQFELYDLTDDIQLHIDQIFTYKWCFATTCTDAMWSIFYQEWGANYRWGGNVWQHPATGVAATVILPPVPQED